MNFRLNRRGRPIRLMRISSLIESTGRRSSVSQPREFRDMEFHEVAMLIGAKAEIGKGSYMVMSINLGVVIIVTRRAPYELILPHRPDRHSRPTTARRRQ